MSTSKNTFEVKSLLDAVKLIDRRTSLTVGQYTIVDVESTSKLLSQDREVIAIDESTGEEVTNIVTDYYYIVNINAMSEYHLDKAEELIDNSDFLAAVNQRHGFRAYVNAGDSCPYSKGEKIKVFAESITTSNGVVGEFITKHSPLPVITATKVNFMDRLKKSEEPAVEETEEVLQGETVVEDEI
jgi:hypothetical protein